MLRGVGEFLAYGAVLAVVVTIFVVIGVAVGVLFGTSEASSAMWSAIAVLVVGALLNAMRE